MILLRDYVRGVLFSGRASPRRPEAGRPSGYSAGTTLRPGQDQKEVITNHGQVAADQSCLRIFGLPGTGAFVSDTVWAQRLSRISGNSAATSSIRVRRPSRYSFGSPRVAACAGWSASISLISLRIAVHLSAAARFFSTCSPRRSHVSRLARTAATTVRNIVAATLTPAYRFVAWDPLSEREGLLTPAVSWAPFKNRRPLFGGAQGRICRGHARSPPGELYQVGLEQLPALRCQRSGVSIEVSSNSPRCAKSTASETPGGGGSAAGGTSSGA